MVVRQAHPVRRRLVMERRQRRRRRHRGRHRGRCRCRRHCHRVARSHAWVAHGRRGGQSRIGGGEGGRGGHGGGGVGRLLRGGSLLVRVRGRRGRQGVRHVELLLGHDVLVLLERAPLLCPPILEPNLDLQ